ncbi:HD domain-containing phosphohydrolase [Paenibacillus aceris]
MDIILYHHERYDGTGYPERLKGEQIPRLARNLSIADSFDPKKSRDSI